MKNKLKIIYTSDVHGQLLASDYANKTKSNFGLSKLSSYLKKVKDDYLLLDNGDVLQGSVLLDYHRQFEPNTSNPVASMMNHLGYQYMTLGNHDFNYGKRYLLEFQKNCKVKILCANIIDDSGKTVFEPYAIHQMNNGLKIGIIGAITAYIPIWEKPEHIKGLTFLDAVSQVNHYAQTIKGKVDLIVLLYHGGFEKQIPSGKPIGRPTHENEGYALSQIKLIDILLTGHQHVPQVYQLTSKRVVLQTGYMARDFGEIDLEFNENMLEQAKATLKQIDFEEDLEAYALLENLENKTQTWLDQNIGTTQLDMTASDPFLMRTQKHPLFQLVNYLQTKHTGCDLSAASLPNQAVGFQPQISLRDLAANFVYPNTLIKLEITGKILREAIERTAEYYTSIQGKLSADESYIYPKEEHYNVDIYDGVEYIIDSRKPKGDRVVSLKHKGEDVTDQRIFTLALNSYRASGGGDYMMFRDAKIIEEYDVTLFKLAYDYIKKSASLDVDVISNFQII